MTRIRFIQPKGGQGATTIAASFALACGLAGRQTTILAHDPDQLAAMLGAPRADVVDLDAAPNVRVLSDPTLAAGGLIVEDGHATGERADATVLVVRNCYLALREAVRLSLDAVVLIEEPGRALDAADVASVLGMPVTVRVPVRPEVARTIDAGMLAFRMPLVLSGPMAELAQILAERETV